ncbi:peptidoglycan DD-metalloendopeptidase family protein [Brevibacillus sp. GCM10020057]|uniref:peptidoglycan DD-metalloendopeptidase family protein n=1 Tax=Brevibacillus sp. GCM10020057 TaxID=3317327 RepID=UPI00363AE7CD
MDFEQTPAHIGSLEEAQRVVVEQALLQAFNPYGSLARSDAPAQSNVMVYAVNQGDTLSGIAQRYGLSLQQLVEQNKISNPNLVAIGMKLVISRDEVKHVVKRGETLNYISRRYGVSRELLIDRNPLLKWLSDNLYVGQVVHVPIVAGRTLQAEDLQKKRNTSQAASRQAIGRVRERMEWPVKGATITSGFGVRWGKAHKGVDLWNESEGQAPIYAAKSGVVVEAGAKRSGYGKLVVLDHGNGLQTFYAHMRAIVVTPGQTVEAGEVLGYMGHTGDSTGYHLHFEVRQDDVPINPLPYLGR